MKKCTFLVVMLLGVLACNNDDSIDNPNGLDVGESKTIVVEAIEFWNDATINIEAGEIYSITSTGEWVDLDIETDADGFSDPILDNFSHLKRVPDANWFELIAAVDSNYFYIVGGDAEITFEQGGSLSFFANDAEDFYDNNSGNISTVITRID